MEVWVVDELCGKELDLDGNDGLLATRPCEGMRTLEKGREVG